MTKFYSFIRSAFFCLVALLLSTQLMQGQGACDPSTPTFTVDLSSSPTATYASPVVGRNGTCCNGADPCVRFIITLHPQSMGINWLHTGADPGGSLQYQVGCGTATAGGQPVCLNGTGPHTMTICKPGGNNNIYFITSLPEPKLPDSIMVRSGCTQTLTVSGFSVPTIRWNAVNSSSAVPNYSAAFNGYLSCVSGCSVTVVTPTASPPAWIDYEVSGYGQAPCLSKFYRDTVRVFFFSDLSLAVNSATICAGQTNAVLTLTASGGKAPLSYTWSTGSNAPAITVGPGTYTVFVNDATGCPPESTVTTVMNFTLPITITGGADLTRCKTNPAAVLNRTVTAASGGSWTTSGTGAFAPTNTANPVTYNPSGADLAAGQVQLFVTTTGNQGCQPDQDTVVIFYQNSPTVTVVPSVTACANNASTTVSGTITGYSPSTPLWSAAAGNTITSPTSLSSAFFASASAVANGSVNVVMTSTNNGVCPPSSATTVVYFSPSPSVNAGPDIPLCSNSLANLNGSITLGATTGSWTSSGNGVFSNVNSLSTSYTPGSADIAAGSATLILKSTANGLCLQEDDTLRLIIAPLTTVNVTTPPGICSDAASISLSGTITGATNTGTWSSGGGGGISPNSAGAATYNLTQGDRSLSQLVFTLTSTNNTICPAAFNTVTVPLSPLATLTAGSNSVTCSTQNTLALNGTALTASWSTTGTGSFNNSNSPTTFYTFSSGDIAAGVVNFTLTSTNNGVCPAVKDSVAMRIRPVAVPNAGVNQFMCSSTNSINLNGSVTGGTNTGSWSSSGTGSFASPNSPVTSYSLSTADITAGQVIFTLTSASNSPCSSVIDTVLIKIFTAPVSVAGTGSLICSIDNPISLTGSVSGSTGTGSWTTNGTGTFPQGSNSVQVTYSMSANDINTGALVFTLSSTNNGPCAAATNTIGVLVKKIAVPNAGLNQYLCSNVSSVNLNGTVSGGTQTGSWTASGGGTFGSPNSALTTYSLSSTDVTAGQVIFTLTSTSNSPCPSVNDTVLVKLFSAPVSVAGTNSFICSTSNPITLSGVISGGTGTGSWTTNGSGTFPQGSNSVQVSYLMSPGDINAGGILFTLHSTNNGPCGSASNTVEVTVKKQATVTAGPSQSLCANNLSVPLNGTINGGSGTVMWLTSGTGSFSPGNTFLQANYHPSSTDIVGGNVLLTLNSTNDNPCALDTDTMRVRINIPSIVNTGTYAPVCSNAATVLLNGTIAGGSQTSQWLSSGNGTFSPNATALNASYRFSQSDILNGGVTFTLTSTNDGVCPPNVKSTTLAIRQQPSVTAVADQSICSTNTSISLNATLTGQSTTGIWTSNGTGTFTPNDITINNTYLVSPNDVNLGKLTFIILTTSNDVCPGAKDTTKLVITKLPVIDLEDDSTICSNVRELFIDPKIANSSGNYSWTTSGSGSFDPDLFTVPATYLFSEQDATSPGVVLTLHTLNNGACGKISSNYSVLINPSPDAGFNASAYTVSLPSEPVVFTNTTKNGGSYFWNFGDGTYTTVPNPVKNYTEVGFYQVVLIAKNQYDCTDTVTQQITVIKEALVPTAFTPNGDKLNPTFRIITDGVVEYDLMIFNRWGELIFRSTDLALGWDGTFNGKDCQQDAYVWKAKIKFFDGRTFDKVGSITLLR